MRIADLDYLTSLELKPVRGGAFPTEVGLSFSIQDDTLTVFDDGKLIFSHPLKKPVKTLTFKFEDFQNPFTSVQTTRNGVDRNTLITIAALPISNPEPI